MTKRFYFITLMLLLASCFPLTANSIKKIDVNDTEEQIIKVLGKPYTKKAYYNKTFLVYYIHDDFFSVFFNIKRFPFVGFYPLLRTGEEYWIIVEDGKVVSFGTSSNFKNNIPKALSGNSITVDVEGN